MRIGLVYKRNPKRWPKFGWVSDALAGLGHSLIHVKSAGELASADEQCGLILFSHKNAGMSRHDIMDIGKNHQSVWAQWWFDLFAIHSGPLNEQPGWRLYSGVMRVMDVVYVKERDMLDEFHQNGVNAEYKDQCCPKNYGQVVHREDPEFDVVVFGNMKAKYRQRRQDVSELVKAGFKVGWAGDGGAPPKGVVAMPWVHPDNLPQLMSRGKVVLSCDFRSDVRGFVSDRVWLALGSGATVVHRACGENGNPGWSGSGLPVIPYYSTSQLPDVVRSAIGTVGERRERGRLAREAVLSRHTYEFRLRSILGDVLRLKDVQRVPREKIREGEGQEVPLS